MADLNRVFLIGNLTKDPELRHTPKGVAVADLRLAVDDGYAGQDGKRVERTLYVDVVAWQRQAETVSEHLSKGSPLFVEGRLELNEWEAPGGEKRSRLRVVANRVQFLGAGKDRQDDSGNGGGEDDQYPF